MTTLSRDVLKELRALLVKSLLFPLFDYISVDVTAELTPRLQRVQNADIYFEVMTSMLPFFIINVNGSNLNFADDDESLIHIFSFNVTSLFIKIYPF